MIDIHKIEPLLLFENNCEEAFGVYKKAFNAEIAVMMRYSDADLSNAEVKPRVVEPSCLAYSYFGIFSFIFR